METKENRKIKTFVAKRGRLFIKILQRPPYQRSSTLGAAKNQLLRLVTSICMLESLEDLKDGQILRTTNIFIFIRCHFFAEFVGMKFAEW